MADASEPEQEVSRGVIRQATPRRSASHAAPASGSLCLGYDVFQPRRRGEELAGDGAGELYALNTQGAT